MCDQKKYVEIFHEIEKLSPDDTLNLILAADSEDEKDFFEMIGDYLLQKKQRQVIERNLF
jgi:hypothetical protein